MTKPAQNRRESGRGRLKAWTESGTATVPITSFEPLPGAMPVRSSRRELAIAAEGCSSPTSRPAHRYGLPDEQGVGRRRCRVAGSGWSESRVAVARCGADGVPAERSLEVLDHRLNAVGVGDRYVIEVEVAARGVVDVLALGQDDAEQ